MRHPEFYAAVFGIIRNHEGKILMIKRQNTGYMDGHYGLPAGHIEGTESPVHAMQRELHEEIGIHVTPTDLKLVNVCHRVNPDRVVIDFYYEVLSYSGTLTNAEPEKSE